MSMSLTCNPSVGEKRCNARVCIKGNGFIHFSAPPVMAEQNSLFHLFNLGNLCVHGEKTHTHAHCARTHTHIHTHIHTHTYTHTYTHREKERERQKRGLNELSLLPGWAQCFYYLRLTGCEAIHSGCCVRGGSFSKLARSWEGEKPGAIDPRDQPFAC
jgi:hypothetical protein